jgi:hypothetical protein
MFSQDHLLDQDRLGRGVVFPKAYATEAQQASTAISGRTEFHPLGIPHNAAASKPG